MVVDVFYDIFPDVQLVIQQYLGGLRPQLD